jgi:undecaprenyl-diphosphatase
MRSRRLEWTALAAGTAALVCLIWLAAKVTVGAAMQFDETVRAAIHSAASPSLTRLFQYAALLGSQPVVIGVPAGAALVLFVRGRRDRAWLLLIAMAGAELLEYVLKIRIHRQRPAPFFGTLLPASYSFPSGHALLSLCCYGTLAAFNGALLRIAAVALILGIGVSRVYLGVHYPTDVIAGYLAATAWMSGVAVLYARLARHD